MSIFLQVLGASLSFLWMAGEVLNNKVLEILDPPYGQLFIKYSWVLMAIGIPLILLSQILKLKARRAKRTNQRSNVC